MKTASCTTEEAIAFITEELQNLSGFEAWLNNQPAMHIIGIARECEGCPLHSYFEYVFGKDRFDFRITSDRIDVLTNEGDFEVATSFLAQQFIKEIDRDRSKGEMVRAASARVALREVRAAGGVE